MFRLLYFFIRHRSNETCPGFVGKVNIKVNGEDEVNTGPENFAVIGYPFMISADKQEDVATSMLNYFAFRRAETQYDKIAASQEYKGKQKSREE